MYVVLVHRPDDEEIFFDYPLLTKTSNPVSTDENGRIIWWAQAMCETQQWANSPWTGHWQLDNKCWQLLLFCRWRLTSDSIRLEVLKKKGTQQYVWDHVSVALYVDNQVILLLLLLTNNIISCGNSQKSVWNQSTSQKTTLRQSSILMTGDSLLKRFCFSACLLSVFQVLQFDDDDLSNSLKFPSQGELLGGRTFDRPEDRDNLVKQLWPNCPALREAAQVAKVEQIFQNLRVR